MKDWPLLAAQITGCLTYTGREKHNRPFPDKPTIYPDPPF